MYRLTLASLTSALILLGVFSSGNGFPGKPHLYRALPSVSDDHYSELLPDGTYKYAYTGENRYHAEKRASDGTVEGETVYVRPDGVPVKVHYFADARGYRPKTEILFSERIRTIEPYHDPRPTVLIAPPPPPEVVHVPVPVKLSHPDDASINARVEGNHINIGGLRSGEDVAIANPSVTAIVGPGGRAELRPESYARAGRGGVAIANPSSTAIVGPGGSVVLAPTARASTGSEHEGPIIVPVPVESIQARHVYTPGPPVHHVGVPVRAPEVLVVPASPSYSYTYSYTAPDSKYPQRDNSAFVDVRVNSK